MALIDSPQTFIYMIYMMVISIDKTLSVLTATEFLYAVWGDINPSEHSIVNELKFNNLHDCNSADIEEWV